MEAGRKIQKDIYLFDYYKLYLESIERISDRRIEANRFFITVNTVLLSLGGVFLKIFEENLPLLLLFLNILLLLGLIISIIFFFLISSYRQLNSGKFRIIHKLEKKLPVKLYTDEWEELGEGKNYKRYFPFSHIEIFIPVVFAVFYVCTFILLLTCF